ncbi:MAG: membrane dipeptidase [Bryobacterales bacterium]|nr:membrane dipeptidase [Bryobacterales bacterium]
MIDLAHASDEAFYHAIETSRAPIINTHAACRAVANHARNLTDDMLRALARNGGVLGVAYYAAMLDDGYRARLPELAGIGQRRAEAARQFRDDKPRLSEAVWRLNQEEARIVPQPPLSRLVDHIEHAAKVAGVNHVGIGSDFDSIGYKLPAGLEDIGKTPALVAALRARGFNAAEVNKIMGGNFLRVLRRNEELAATR